MSAFFESFQISIEYKRRIALKLTQALCLDALAMCIYSIALCACLGCVSLSLPRSSRVSTFGNCYSNCCKYENKMEKMPKYRIDAEPLVLCSFVFFCGFFAVACVVIVVFLRKIRDSIH